MQLDGESCVVLSSEIIDLKPISDFAAYTLGIIKLGEWVFSALKPWWRKHRPAATELIDRRIKMREEIERNLKWSKRYIDRPATATQLATRIEVIDFEEIVIRDIWRMDKFPKVDENAVGISPWFKVGVMGLYDRGIEVFLSGGRNVVQVEDGWLLLPSGEQPDGAQYAACVGRIPFHLIERIDWSRSDPYYYAPQFFCHFSGPLRGPYEDVIYKTKLYPTVSDHYSEIGLREESYEWGFLRRGAFLFRQNVIRYWRRLWKLVGNPAVSDS